ncbi:MAG: hypothetical protein CMJ46_14510 [Planctomyces sp.]|nr:hypothetical protein [Planctomyces sp.]
MSPEKIMKKLEPGSEQSSPAKKASRENVYYALSFLALLLLCAFFLRWNYRDNPRQDLIDDLTAANVNWLPEWPDFDSPGSWHRFITPVSESHGVARVYADTNAELSDDHLSRLHLFSELQQLSISNADLSSTALNNIDQNQNLESLFLCGLTIDVSVLNSISRLPELKNLYLLSIQIEGEPAWADSKFASLETLRLTNINRPGDFFSDQERFPALNKLILDVSQSDDETLGLISDIKSMRMISLRGSQYTLNGLEVLTQLPELRELHLFQTDLTYDDVHPLHDLKEGLQIVIHTEESMEVSE